MEVEHGPQKETGWSSSRPPFSTEPRKGNFLICKVWTLTMRWLKIMDRCIIKISYLTTSEVIQFNNSVLMLPCESQVFQGWSSQNSFWYFGLKMKFFLSQILTRQVTENNHILRSNPRALITKGSEFSHQTEYHPGFCCFGIFSQFCLSANMLWTS